MSRDRKVSVGDLAPDFTLSDQTGTPVRLQDLIGRKTVVLYFYPKDETPGCTIEARAFRDNYEQFSAKDAEVVGVSSDSVRSHRRFAQRHNLPFLLLSDRDGAVRRLYGVEKTLGLLPGRVTYVIDRRGMVRHVFNSMTNISQHVDDVLEAVRQLQAEQRA